MKNEDFCIVQSVCRKIIICILFLSYYCNVLSRYETNTGFGMGAALCIRVQVSFEHLV